MKSKKYFLILSVLVGALAVTACGGGTKQEVDPGKVSSDGVRELNLAGSVRRFPGEDKAWESVIAKFEDENPDIKVNVRWQGQWNEIPQNMATAKLSGENVDIFTAGAGVINSTLARSGSLMDITELMEPLRDRFPDGMLNAYTIGDKLWGFPYGDADTSVVYYNKDMFEELGIEVPKTFDDLLEISKIIKEEKNITPMLHQGKVADFWPMWFFETYAQTSQNTSVDNVRAFLTGDKTFTNEAEQEAFVQIKRFFDEGVLSADSLDTDGDGMRAALAQQKTAMFYGGTWEYNPTASIVKDFEIGIFEFPQMVANATPQHGGGPADAIVIPSFAPQENLDISMKFIEFMLRPENANEILSTYSPNVGVVKGVEPVDSPIKEVLNRDVVPNTIMFLDWIWPAEINEAVVQSIPAVIAGAMTPEEATQGIQEALERLKEEKEFTFDWWTAWTDSDWEKVTPKNIPSN